MICKYDSSNRLTSVVSGTIVGTFEYNSDGLRTSMTVNGVKTSYLWDTNESLPVILTDTNSIYIYGLSLLARQTGDTVEYYHSDALGSVRSLTNGSGQNIGAYSYRPFGESLSTSGSSTNAFLYTGQLGDQQTGLYYLRARYYSPETGRFTARDPFSGYPDKPQTLNAYSYGWNNPLTYIDLTGNIADVANPLERFRLCGPYGCGGGGGGPDWGWPTFPRFPITGDEIIKAIATIGGLLAFGAASRSCDVSHSDIGGQVASPGNPSDPNSDQNAVDGEFELLLQAIRDGKAAGTLGKFRLGAGQLGVRGLETFEGSLSFDGQVARVSVDMLQGSNNQMEASQLIRLFNNLKSLARAGGAQSMEIRAVLANERLLELLEAGARAGRWTLETSSGGEVIRVPIP